MTEVTRTKKAILAEIDKLKGERIEANKEARRTQNAVKDLVFAVRGFSFTGPEAETFLQANAAAQAVARQAAKDASGKVKQLRGKEEALWNELQGVYRTEGESADQDWLDERLTRIKKQFPNRLWNSTVRSYEAALVLLEERGSLVFTRDIHDTEYGEAPLSAEDEAALFEVLQARALGKDK